MVQTSLQNAPGSGSPERSGSRVRERRRAILQAAAHEFRDRGFHATGMRDIARALGMTVGNLYYYFESKEALLAYCQEETLGRLLSVGDWARRDSTRADESLFRLIVGHVCCLNETAPGSLAHLETEGLGDRYRAPVVAKRDAYEGRVREFVREGIESGVFRDTDPKVTALAILGAVNWTVKWFRPDGTRDARSIGRDFAEQFVRGLLAEGVTSRVPTFEVPLFDDADER